MIASPLMLTVHIPLTIRRRGGRKVVIAPDGTEAPAVVAARIDSTLVKALARAFRWRRMLETGVVSTVGEIAVREKINKSYVSRILRLTLLAPDIVEAILDGRQSVGVTLPILMESFPVDWLGQRRRFTDCFSRTGRPLSGLISTAPDLLGNGAESCGVGITRDDCCTAVPFSSTCAYRSANNTLRSSLRVRTAGCQSGSTAPSNVKAVVGSRFLT